MKKIKLFLGLIVIILIGLVIYQNWEFFSDRHALNLSLFVKTWHWTTSEIQNIVYWTGCFVIGLLISGFIGISSKWKSRKTIKSLNATIESHLKMISSLKNELEAFRNDPYKTASPTDSMDQTGSVPAASTKEETA